MSVVDGFEVVDVGDGDRQRSLRPGGPGDLHDGLALPAPAFSSPVLASVRAAAANEAWRSDRCSTIARGNATTRARALCAAANAVSTARHSSVTWLQTASRPRTKLRSRVPGAAVAMTGGRIRQAPTAMLTSPHPAASVIQAGAWPPDPRRGRAWRI